MLFFVLNIQSTCEVANSCYTLMLVTSSHNFPCVTSMNIFCPPSSPQLLLRIFLMKFPSLTICAGHIFTESSSFGRFHFKKTVFLLEAFKNLLCGCFITESSIPHTLYHHHNRHLLWESFGKIYCIFCQYYFYILLGIIKQILL